MKRKIIAFEYEELKKHITNLCYRYNDIMKAASTIRAEANAETPVNLAKLENAITLENRAYKLMEQFNGICNFVTSYSDTFFFIGWNGIETWTENRTIANVTFEWQTSDYTPDEIVNLTDENKNTITPE